MTVRQGEYPNGVFLAFGISSLDYLEGRYVDTETAQTDRAKPAEWGGLHLLNYKLVDTHEEQPWRD